MTEKQFEDLTDDELEGLSDEEFQSELEKLQPSDVWWVSFGPTKMVSYSPFDPSTDGAYMRALQKQVSLDEIVYFQQNGLKEVPVAMLPHQALLDVDSLIEELQPLADDIKSKVEYSPVGVVFRFFENLSGEEGDFSPVQAELPLKEG